MGPFAAVNLNGRVSRSPKSFNSCDFHLFAALAGGSFVQHGSNNALKLFSDLSTMPRCTMLLVANSPVDGSAINNRDAILDSMDWPNRTDVNSARHRH
jgi:hypothetical protein